MKLKFMPRIVSVAAILLPILAVGCGGNDGMMTGPGGVSRNGATLLSVAPSGGAVGVSVGSPMTSRFSAPMASGMEAFADLHEGGLDGHIVLMGCTFSSDRTILTCVPGTPLRARTSYTLHLGAGMMDSDGHAIDMDEYRASMGGQWIQGSMMGSSHDTSPWGMMGGNWRGANGSYGMAFPFTTE